MDWDWKKGTLGLLGSVLAGGLLPQAAISSGPDNTELNIARPGPVQLSHLSPQSSLVAQEMQASPTSLFVAYPPAEHETVAARIFFIGTADPSEPVTIHGHPI
ncbi:MAG: hypothetical protein ACFB16_14990 [Phormidesmis sp.]